MDKENISYFTLGTVQIGMKYGISNRTGMPGKEEALNILATALENDVNSFDTSFLYGTSEEVIGEFIRGNNVRRHLFINSKMPKIDPEGKNGIYEKVRGYILSSREKLAVDVIDTYMMHDAGDICSHGGLVVENLIRAKKEGLIASIGVSVYYPEEALKIIDIPEIESIQIPFNIFDTRFYSCGVLKKLKEAGKIIFARSIFLQGMFFLENAELSDKMPEALSYVTKLNELARKFNMTVDELAVRFVKSFPEIRSVVLGAETAAQVERNAFLSEKEKLADESREETLRVFYGVPENVYLPLKWKKTG